MQTIRPRAGAAGIAIGTLPHGPLDAITDVVGAQVGHCTVTDGKDVHPGVTVVLPHGGNLFADRVPCAIHVMNGFGKLAGRTQVDELGELETPIALTNTLAVGTVGAGSGTVCLGYKGGIGTASRRSVNTPLA
jgi:D-aminopeptidase